MDRTTAPIPSMDWIRSAGIMAHIMPRIVISGGPGAGKTTLLGELAALGYTCAPNVAISPPGAITALVERTPDGFVWRDFAFENNYDASITDAESYRAVGPFVFNKTENHAERQLCRPAA